jgi:hypothetical protein
MSPDDRQKLRDLAAAATPGPWQEGMAGTSNVVHFDGDDITGVASARPHNAAFIAAASPTTVIALLDDNDQLGEACAKWQDHFTDTPGLAAANAEIVSLRFQLEAMTAARDEACCWAEEYLLARNTVVTPEREARINKLRKVGSP